MILTLALLATLGLVLYLDHRWVLRRRLRERATRLKSEMWSRAHTSAVQSTQPDDPDHTS